MNKTVVAKVDNGVEALLRIVGTLKRKRFSIKKINMEEIADSSYVNLMITFDDDTDAQRAINQIEKIIDVLEVKKLNLN